MRQYHNGSESACQAEGPSPILGYRTSGDSSMAEQVPSKYHMGVRFAFSAPSSIGGTAYTLVLGTSAERLTGANPVSSTNFF